MRKGESGCKREAGKGESEADEGESLGFRV